MRMTKTTTIGLIMVLLFILLALISTKTCQAQEQQIEKQTQEQLFTEEQEASENFHEINETLRKDTNVFQEPSKHAVLPTPSWEDAWPYILGGLALIVLLAIFR